MTFDRDSSVSLVRATLRTSGPWFLLSLILLGLGVFLFWPLTVDDSFITFRYAENLAGGGGIRWNLQEDPVEGCTTFLWLIILAAAAKAGLGVVTLAKVLGVAAAIGTLVAMIAFSTALRRSGAHHIAVSFAAVLFALYAPTGIHAVSGMETSFFTLLVCLFLAVFLRCQDELSGGSPFALSLLALCCGLTRPEGNLIVGVALLVGSALHRPLRRQRFWIPILLGYALPGLVYFLLRMDYFGHLLPAPFAIKTGQSPIPVQSGPGYVFAFLKQGVALFGFALVGWKAGGRRTLPIVVSIVAFLAFFAMTHPIMGYSNRYLHPVLPPVLVFAVFGISTTLEWAKKRTLYPIVAAGCVLVLAAQVLSLSKNWWFAWKWTSEYSERAVRAHVHLGKKLRQLDQSGESLLAVHDAGALAYYSGWRVFDLVGLNNESIAFEDPTVDDIVAVHPDVVVMNSYGPQTFEHWGYDHAIYQGYLDEGMDRAAVVTGTVDNYYLFVLAWPGTEIFRALADNATQLTWPSSDEESVR